MTPSPSPAAVPPRSGTCGRKGSSPAVSASSLSSRAPSFQRSSPPTTRDCSPAPSRDGASPSTKCWSPACRSSPPERGESRTSRPSSPSPCALSRRRSGSSRGLCRRTSKPTATSRGSTGPPSPSPTRRRSADRGSMAADSSRTIARTIVHVAQLEISRESGMGRVAWHWRQELEARGYSFLHIGPREVGRPVHPALFPYAAWRRVRRLGVRPAAFLVHEPAGVPFVVAGAPAFVFSHGLERRGWEAALAQAAASGPPIRARSRLLFPFWRLRQADFSLRRARAVLVLNRDDLAGVQELYGRRREDLFLFRNGVEPWPAVPRVATEAPPTVLFLGSWLARKGTATLARAADLLRRR